MDTAHEPESLEMARKYVWWKPPEEALTDQAHFVAQMMTLATLDDTAWLRSKFSKEELKAALQHAPAGVFTGRAWHYWHIRLGISPIPPLPTRRIS